MPPRKPRYDARCDPPGGSRRAEETRIRSFRQRVADFVRYRRITHNMEHRFPDATHGLFAVLGSGTNYMVPVALFLQVRARRRARQTQGQRRRPSRGLPVVFRARVHSCP